MTEEHWDRDKEKFEEDFEGRRDYRDEDRGYGGGNTIIENQTFVDDNDRYGGGYRRGDDTIIQNETIVNDDRYGDDQYYKETTVVRDDGYGDSGYRRDEYRDDYRDDSLVDDAARWTGNKASLCQCTLVPEQLLTVHLGARG